MHVVICWVENNIINNTQFTRLSRIQHTHITHTHRFAGLYALCMCGCQNCGVQMFIIVSIKKFIRCEPRNRLYHIIRHSSMSMYGVYTSVCRPFWLCLVALILLLICSALHVTIMSSPDRDKNKHSKNWRPTEYLNEFFLLSLPLCFSPSVSLLPSFLYMLFLG